MGELSGELLEALACVFRGKFEWIFLSLSQPS